MKLEYRACAFDYEAKEISDDGTISGYGSIFGNTDLYGDVVAPGAFKATLRDWKARKKLPPLLWQHRSDQPLGPHLDLQEDERGLKLKAQLLRNDVKQAGEAFALLKAEAINGLSIGYVVPEGGAKYDDKTGIRTIKRLDLWEVSIVTFPANREATVDAVKSALTHGRLPSLPEFEEFLREAGFSKTQAAAIAGKGLKTLLRGEPGDIDFDTAMRGAVDEFRNILKPL